jgi:hypothetical protein
MFISVVLPAPFSPSKAWISPPETSTVTSSFATTPGNRFVMPFSSRCMTAPAEHSQGANGVCSEARTPEMRKGAGSPRHPSRVAIGAPLGGVVGGIDRDRAVDDALP